MPHTALDLEEPCSGSPVEIQLFECCSEFVQVDCIEVSTSFVCFKLHRSVLLRPLELRSLSFFLGVSLVCSTILCSFASPALFFHTSEAAAERGLLFIRKTLKNARPWPTNKSRKRT